MLPLVWTDWFPKKQETFSISLKHGTTLKMGLTYVSLTKILFSVLKLEARKLG